MQAQLVTTALYYYFLLLLFTTTLYYYSLLLLFTVNTEDYMQAQLAALTLRRQTRKWRQAMHEHFVAWQACNDVVRRNILVWLPKL